MDDSSDAVKIIKYILFGCVLLTSIDGVTCDTVIQDLSQPPEHILATAPSPEEFRRELSSHFPDYPHTTDLDHDPGREFSGPKDARPGPPRRPPPPPNRQRRPFQAESAGALCSIFRTFLETRRLRRCQISNGPPPRSRYPPPPPPFGHHEQSLPLSSNDISQQNPPVDINNVLGAERGRGPGTTMSLGARQPISPPSTTYTVTKQYESIHESQINLSGEEGALPDDLLHAGLPPPPPPPPNGPQAPPQDPTKISQDRSMILVPHRNCPSGQRRGRRGYCRRLVKIKTNYRYGPPPRKIVRPVPIRYYYSRVVAFPALHFLFPNVS